MSEKLNISVPYDIRKPFEPTISRPIVVMQQDKITVPFFFSVVDSWVQLSPLDHVSYMNLIHRSNKA